MGDGGKTKRNGLRGNTIFLGLMLQKFVNIWQKCNVRTAPIPNGQIFGDETMVTILMIMLFPFAVLAKLLDNIK